EIVNLMMDSDFKQSALFIHQKITQYDFRLIFDFYNNTSLSIDIVCSEFKEGIYAITEINVFGINKLYNSEGTSIYELDDNIANISRERIKEEICKKIGAPESKIVFTFIGVPDEIERIGCPYEYKLYNYQIKSES